LTIDTKYYAEKQNTSTKKSNAYRIFRHSFFFGIVRQDDRKQFDKYFVSQQFIKPVENLCDALGGVVITDEGKHQRAGSEVNREEYLAALASLNGVHLHYGNVRVSSNEFLEVIVGASYMTLLIDTDRFLLFANPVSYLPGEVDVSNRQKPCIDVVVDSLFIKHDVISIFDTYVMNRLSLLHEGSDDCINTLQFLLGYSKALTAFAAYCLVFLLGILGIIQMSLQLAAVPLRTSITNIRRFKNSKTMHLFEVRADFITGFRAGTTVLAVFLNTWFADIFFVGAGLTMQTRVEGPLLFDLEVSFDFLGYRRGILPQD